MSATKPDRLERWLRERFRLRQSLREAWEGVRIRDEGINATVKKLRTENDKLKSNNEDLKQRLELETANR